MSAAKLLAMPMSHRQAVQWVMNDVDIHVGTNRLSHINVIVRNNNKLFLLIAMIYVNTCGLSHADEPGNEKRQITHSLDGAIYQKHPLFIIVFMAFYRAAWNAVAV